MLSSDSRLLPSGSGVVGPSHLFCFLARFKMLVNAELEPDNEA